LTIPHDSHGRFFNPGIPEHGFRELLKWMGSRHPGLWQSWILSSPGPKPPERVSGSDLRVTFINHSTVLLQTEDLNLLTDPVWSSGSARFPLQDPGAIVPQAFASRTFRRSTPFLSAMTITITSTFQL
jgi:hypothetical protein